jgi:hypothetical protein
MTVLRGYGDREVVLRNGPLKYPIIKQRACCQSRRRRGQALFFVFSRACRRGQALFFVFSRACRRGQALFFVFSRACTTMAMDGEGDTAN